MAVMLKQAQKLNQLKSQLKGGTSSQTVTQPPAGTRLFTIWMLHYVHQKTAAENDVNESRENEPKQRRCLWEKQNNELKDTKVLWRAEGNYSVEWTLRSSHVIQCK